MSNADPRTTQDCPCGVVDGKVYPVPDCPVHGSLFAALRDAGWFNLSGEQQDALIEEGWHPGPDGGCGRRIGRYRWGYCGTDGLCPACWADRHPRVPQRRRAAS